MPLNKRPALRFNQNSFLSGLLTASNYDYPLTKRTIHCFKYDFVRDLAKPLGELMAEKLVDFSDSVNNITLIPVPLHKRRLRWRGFNQAEELALIVGQKLNLPVINNLIIRTKYTLPQVKIGSVNDRKENIKQAFALNYESDPKQAKEVRYNQIGISPEARFRLIGRTSLSEKERISSANPIKNKTVILIDDISTTGATLKECAKVLRILKPKEIWGLVIAQG
jgi:predicted amidophosphoribosyltransferase